MQTSPDYMEGPWMIKRNGKYILFTAAPYTGPKRGEQPASPPDLAQGYWVGAAVADNIWGPYKKQPQIFLGAISPSSPGRMGKNGLPIAAKPAARLRDAYASTPSSSTKMVPSRRPRPRQVQSVSDDRIRNLRWRPSDSIAHRDGIKHGGG
jgi:hypothetical protein